MSMISGVFETRREAEMAIERLVQTYGVDRAAIAVTAAGAENTAGTEVAGADARRGETGSDNGDAAALNGRVMVSVAADAPVWDVFGEYNAADVREGSGSLAIDSGQS